MRNANPATSGPQLQGPPNYPGPGGRPNINPPFDPRMLSTGGANPALKDRPIKRGRIVALQGGLQVNFMFNPSVLGVNFTYDDSVADPTKTDTGQFGGAQASYPGQGSLTVDLLVDRTYEVWDRKDTIASKFGVHADVLAFYAFVGMIDPGINTATSWEALYPTSQIVRQDSYLYIGDRLKYYGYITSLAVQYVHWSYDMVPTRAAISLGYNVLLTTPSSQSSSSNDSSNSSGSTTAPKQEAIPGRDYPVGPVG